MAKIFCLQRVLRGGEGSKGGMYQVWGQSAQGLGLGRVATAAGSHWPCTKNGSLKSLIQGFLCRTLFNFERRYLRNRLTDFAEILHGAAPGQGLLAVKISASSDNVFFLLDKKRGGMSKTLFLACFVNFDKLLRPNLPRDFDEILC